MHPISKILCEAYNLLREENEVKFELCERHVDAIDSVVKTVNAEYFGFITYPTLKDKASAYFYYLINDHPVPDGNKRLAVLFLKVVCISHNLEIKLPNGVSLDELAVAVEQSKIDNATLIPMIKKILFG